MSFKWSTPTGPKDRAERFAYTNEYGITKEERIRRYTEFSESYDETVSAVGFVAPKSAADMLASLYSPETRENILILDVAAGTGLAGEELHKQGFKMIDALEPSSGMLGKAREKGVYRKYFCEYLTEDPLDIQKDTYDAITVVGSTDSHKPSAIFEMIRLIKPGGYICIVSRMEVIMKGTGYKDVFFPFCDKLEKEGKWNQVKRDSCPYMSGIEGICICYRIC